MLYGATGNPGFGALEAQFQRSIGRRIVHLQCTSSTMDIAHAIIRETAEVVSLHGMVIIADEQTKGRGRFGRSWDSRLGEDILASVILCPRPAIAGGLTTMASLAAAMTVDQVTSRRSVIKWPNDVLIDGEKICGVIAESVTMGNSFVGILGIGLNVNRRPEPGGAPEYLATSIRNVSGDGAEIDRREVTKVLLGNMNELYDALDRGESIMPEWREKLIGFGSSIDVTTLSEQRGEAISGIAEDVDEFGRLMIRQRDGTIRAVAAGEVTTRSADHGR